MSQRTNRLDSQIQQELIARSQRGQGEQQLQNPLGGLSGTTP